MREREREREREIESLICQCLVFGISLCVRCCKGGGGGGLSVKLKAASV